MNFRECNAIHLYARVNFREGGGLGQCLLSEMFSAGHGSKGHALGPDSAVQQDQFAKDGVASQLRSTICLADARLTEIQ